ncbi:GNAT family N-acetyltransferase [Hymenobacter sp. BT175]|uniref:GNAT family N-acetyltransferase n=1 Tax=Hymenobacter translucens TaxID=2886507 RepID=UPI001D0DDB4B|nr:GNAT family N-acetyltransferase [Hymenobacter translucens]MCC2545117.1 GNAT family N-acetyltransferase [Hymenobacter translucens]
MSLITASSSLLPLPGADDRYAVRQHQGEGPGPAPALPPAYEPFLYLKPAHLALQRHPGIRHTFYLEDQTAGLTVAQLQVVAEPGTGTGHSPWQAPFGAVQLADVPAAVLESFLETVHATLRAHGLSRLRLRSYPFAYDPAGSARLTHVLRRLGYAVELAELNNHLALNSSFESRLHPSERRRLQKCRRHGFVFEQEPPLLLPLAYDFLARCREEKGQQLSLPLERLQELFVAFPRQHFLFSVRDAAGQWAALTVAIQVSSQVLYNFYPASPLAFNGFSPVVMLNEGLHTFGRANGMQLLDLGTSTLPTGLNHSLLQFKRHLGGVLSLKLTFAKQL